MEQKRASRSSLDTELGLGYVGVPIKLYRATADPKDVSWKSRMVDPETGEPPPVEEEEEVTVEKTPPIGFSTTMTPPLAEPPSAPADPGNPLDLPDAWRPDDGDEDEPVLVKQRGMETVRGWVPVEDQLTKIDAETRIEDVRVVCFVARSAFPRGRVLGSYWVAPGGPLADETPGAVPLRALQVSLARNDRIALVRWTKKTNQAMGVITPLGGENGALNLVELAWAEDWRRPPVIAEAIAQAPVPTTVQQAFDELVAAMSRPASAIDELADTGRAARRALEEELEAGKVPEVKLPQAPAEPEGVVTLISKLQASTERADAFAAR